MMNSGSESPQTPESDRRQAEKRVGEIWGQSKWQKKTKSKTYTLSELNSIIKQHEEKEKQENQRIYGHSSPSSTDQLGPIIPQELAALPKEVQKMRLDMLWNRSNHRSGV